MGKLTINGAYSPSAAVGPGCYASYHWATWTADSPWSPRFAADGDGTHKNLEGRGMIKAMEEL